jgi:SET domain-containing protein
MLYDFSRLHVGPSRVCDGAGVFAAKPIAANELILAERVYILPAEAQLSPSEFFDEYAFSWGDHGAGAVIPIGVSMLINHGGEESANVMWSGRDNVIEWFALRDIAVGEELLFNYNGRGSREPRTFP